MVENYQATILSPWVDVGKSVKPNYKALIRVKYNLVKCKHIDEKSARSQPPDGECMLWCVVSKHTYNKIKYDKRFKVLWVTSWDGTEVEVEVVKQGFWDKAKKLARKKIF